MLRAASPREACARKFPRFLALLPFFVRNEVPSFPCPASFTSVYETSLYRVALYVAGIRRVLE